MPSKHYKAVRKDGVVAVRHSPTGQPYTHALVYPRGLSVWRASFRLAKAALGPTAREQGAEICETVEISVEEYVRISRG